MPPLMQSQLAAIEGKIEVVGEEGEESGWRRSEEGFHSSLPSFFWVCFGGGEAGGKQSISDLSSPISPSPLFLPSSPVTTTDSPSAGWQRRRTNDGEGIAHLRKHSWSSVCGKTGLNLGWQVRSHHAGNLSYQSLPY